jgi:hypothetical protein
MFFDTCLGAPDTSSVPFTFDKCLKRVCELGSKKLKQYALADEILLTPCTIQTLEL